MSPEKWDLFKAAHLLKRAGFGGGPDRVLAMFKAGLTSSVDALLGATPEEIPAPEWAVPRDKNAMRKELRALEEEERQERIRQGRREDNRRLTELRGQWLQRMLTTPDPVREKMTLFWHGHFATSISKVNDPYLMWLQNETFRRHALGDFGVLLREISRDPAMMVWLDLQQSRKRSPNENFARELMELFTLGEGNYTEEDVKNAARAFTGYRMNQQTQSFSFLEREHDAGEKTFLTRTGSFSGDDIVEILLQEPQCARFIARKIWVFFVEENPSEKLVDALAEELLSTNFQIAPLLRTIFLSEEFFADTVMGTQIKGPVQWLVGTAAILDMPSLEEAEFQRALQQMGQVLFAPPNVKGWDGGKAWISTSTLLFRYNFAGVLLKGGNYAGIRSTRTGRPELEDVAPPEIREDPAKLVKYLVLRIFQAPVPDKDIAAFEQYFETRAAEENEKVAGLVHLMLSTPRYQLT